MSQSKIENERGLAPQLKAWDDLIRRGEVYLVQEAIRALMKSRKLANAPTRYLIELARLARRCADFSLAFRLIEPLVKKDGERIPDAPPAAQLEYANLLIDVGIQGEGALWLARLSSDHLPKKLLVEAVRHFTNWDYAPAIPLLERYISLLDPLSYDCAVAWVNLISARSFFGDIEQLAEEKTREFSARGFNVLAGNLLEIRASQLLNRNRLGLAEEYLDQALSLHHQARRKDSLYIQKWQLVLNLKRRRATAQDVLSFRQAHPHEWETHRSLDFEYAKIIADQRLLRHLWFGSAAEKFRETVQSFVAIPDEFYDFTPGTNPLTKPCATSLASLGDLGESLPAGKLRELYRAVIEDFYRPRTAYELIHFVFHDEVFSHKSSVAKFHQLVHRLRVFLQKNSWPLALRNRGDYYEIISTSPCRLTKSRAFGPGPSQTQITSENVLKLLQQRPHTSAELARLLNLSQRRVQLYLKDLEVSARIHSIRRGLYSTTAT